MIDLMFKASSKEAFEQFATEKGWLHSVTLSEREGGGTALVSVSGVDIDHIGAVTLTPAVMSEGEGMGARTVITPAVMDNDFYVNVRLSADKAEAEKVPEAQRAKETITDKDGVTKEVPSTKLEEATATVAAFAAAVKEPQALGEGWKMNVGDKGGWVVCIDPTTVPVPPRVWQ